MHDCCFYTRSGLLVALGYERLVRGGRGDYIEFTKGQLVTTSFHIPQNCRWRTLPEWRGRIYYLEYRSIDESYIKLYYQRKRVNYADYLIGYFYISPKDLIWEGGTNLPLLTEAETEEAYGGCKCCSDRGCGGCGYCIEGRCSCFDDY